MIPALLSIWWFWVALALVLALIELLAPSFIFLGFALGALATAALVGMADGLSLPATLAGFSVVSLLAWIGLRLAFRRQSSDARIITHDINDD